jgi:hypothetical protein
MHNVSDSKINTIAMNRCIVKRRTAFEYKLQRRIVQEADFLRYIQVYPPCMVATSVCWYERHYSTLLKINQQLGFL